MKKLNKFFAILVSLAMMATLCVCMAFADNSLQADNVSLNKTLTKNAGTTTPDATFKFTATPNTTLGDSHVQAVTLPDIVYPAQNDPATQSTDLDALIEAALANQPNGLYVYDVQEDVANSTQNSSGNTFYYDTTFYRVRVYKSGTAADPVYKYTVAVVTNPGTDNEQENKVTPEPTTGDEESVINMPFENKYVKTTIVDPNGDPDDPETPGTDEEDHDAAGFSLEKNVTKDGSGLYADKDFAFPIEVTAPAVNTIAGDKTGYSYKIVKVGATQEEIDAVEAQTITINAETLKGSDTINLKTGERLVFIDLDVGATVKVAESNYADDFIQKAVFNDAAEEYTATTEETYTVAETASELQVTNECKNDTTPTGILINNLPYIALALVAIGGLCAYVIVRRKADDEA